MGDQLRSHTFGGFDIELLKLGIVDAFFDKDLKVNPQDLQVSFLKIGEKLRAANENNHKGGIEEGKNFLAENAKRDAVVVLTSGLQYEVFQQGDGEKPSYDSIVRTHYKGSLVDGTVFDSSIERGQPAEFPVEGVISGWTEALQMMPVGSTWRLFVPYQLGYGERGTENSIPPFATLIFDLQLLEIVPA